jgi:C-terminal peptidase prc
MQGLKKQGVNRLIFDLRGNSGGYLNEAIEVADEFLPAGKLIVYTKGLHRPKQTATSTSEGEWDHLPVVVLIDEGSASASEIVAGAIQDNDRGTILGRRSFGKGLVQEQVNLTDGSALRLTVARYYTPTGGASRNLIPMVPKITIWNITIAMKTVNWRVPTASNWWIRSSTGHREARSFMVAVASCRIYLFRSKTGNN